MGKLFELIAFSLINLTAVGVTFAGAWVWVKEKRFDKLSQVLLVWVGAGVASYFLAAQASALPLLCVTATAGAYQLAKGHTLPRPFAITLTSVLFVVVMLFPTNTNEVAALLLLMMPYNKTKNEWAMWALTLFFTFSRTAWLASAGVVAVVYYPHIIKRLPPWALVAIGASVGVGLIWLEPATVIDRIKTWGDAMNAFTYNIAIGIGLGGYRFIEHSGVTIRHADSVIFTVLAEQGLAGVLAWGQMVIAFALTAQMTRQPARWGLLALAIMCVFDAPIFFPSVALLLGVMLAQATQVSIFSQEFADVQKFHA